MVGFDDLDYEPDDAGGREEIRRPSTPGHGELAEEVLVNLAERVTCDVQRTGGKAVSRVTRMGFV